MEETSAHRMVLTRDLPTAGERSTLHRAVRCGRYVRVVPGAALPADDWENLPSESRHRVKARALQLLHPSTVFCSLTAALIWQRPLLGAAPERVHALASGDRNRGSTASFRRHERSGQPDVHDLDGLSVTSLERTLVDVAKQAHRHVAVAMIDHALSAPNGEAWPAAVRTTTARLIAELEASGPRAAVKARLALTAATGRSGSPGETACRLSIVELGFPAPVLQAAHRDGDGLIGYTDFFWPEHGVVVEFDGIAKYVREEYTGGRDTASVVLAEKRREDRLRALGYIVVRVEWRDLREPARLRAKLLKAGLPLTGIREPQWLR